MGVRIGWRRAVIVVSAAATLLGLADLQPTVARADGAQTLEFRDAAGLEVLAATLVCPDDTSLPCDRRQYDVEVISAALGSPAHVRILVPADYAPSGRVRYPTLYLYAGTNGSASSWVEGGRAAELTADDDLIVVMPDVGFGGAGWFSDWLDQGTTTGPNQWETFQIEQLIPWIDANLRTSASREGRAVAGLSQGGFGSMVAAVRHPDLFVSAASFSGAVDIAYDPATDPDPATAGEKVPPTSGEVPTAVPGHAFVFGTLAADGIQPFAIFGDPVTDEVNWQGHDPATLVANLQGMDAWLFTGNGFPGEHDDPNGGVDPVEALAHTSTYAMYDHAIQLGVPVNLVDYGPGTHTWPYWIDDMRETYLPRLRQLFASPPPPPGGIHYESIDKSWTQWGWNVDLDRPVERQFSYLHAAGPSGFTLTGAGTARVRTPPFYVPGAVKVVTISAPAGATTSTVVADGDGRLTLEVPLAGGDTPEVLGRTTLVGHHDTPRWGGTATVSIH